MIVYRACSASYVSLDGQGAFLYGGRWNSSGVAVNYAAGTSALAILETRVHLRVPPVDYVLLTVEIGDEYVEASLPGEILHAELHVTRAVGDVYFAGAANLPLRVPSVVAPAECNFLFSPEYARNRATILKVEPLVFDRRLWT
jgi:RES domain-containing protein